jgi:hypothetical protein
MLAGIFQRRWACLAFTIDTANRIVSSAAWGIVTDSDMVDHVRGLKADPRFAPSFAQVVDFRGTTELRAGSAGARACRPADRAPAVTSPG